MIQKRQEISKKPPVNEILSHRKEVGTSNFIIEILSICRSEGIVAIVNLFTKFVELQEINKSFPLAGWRINSYFYKIACHQTSPTI